jgi:hypothetical protein
LFVEAPLFEHEIPPPECDRPIFVALNAFPVTVMPSTPPEMVVGPEYLA